MVVTSAAPSLTLRVSTYTVPPIVTRSVSEGCARSGLRSSLTLRVSIHSVACVASLTLRVLMFLRRSAIGFIASRVWLSMVSGHTASDDAIEHRQDVVDVQGFLHNRIGISFDGLAGKGLEFVFHPGNHDG